MSASAAQPLRANDGRRTARRQGAHAPGRYATYQIDVLLGCWARDIRYNGRIAYTVASQRNVDRCPISLLCKHKYYIYININI
jgi:hypothetical protein